MTRKAVLICPGRGTYNKPELGYLARHHSDKAALLAGFDRQRLGAGQAAVTALDAAAGFESATYTRGDTASALIYACALADARSLADDIEVVAVTGNSMGWYIALAAGGALSADDGFHVTNTMGTLMSDHGTGGQLVYPVLDADWRDDAGRRAGLLAQVAAIDARAGHDLALSIDLGGMLVLAGNAAGLAAFETAVPAVDRFPVRLPNHAAFHTGLMAPVAAAGRRRLDAAMLCQPMLPLIDGRGHVWWPGACDTAALWDYTLGHQVIRPYDFTRAVTVAAREFAPDLFIVAGPGDTLGGAVAQSLVLAGWAGMRDRDDFRTAQAAGPLLAAMGRPDQRGLATATDAG